MNSGDGEFLPILCLTKAYLIDGVEQCKEGSEKVPNYFTPHYWYNYNTDNKYSCPKRRQFISLDNYYLTQLFSNAIILRIIPQTIIFKCNNTTNKYSMPQTPRIIHNISVWSITCLSMLDWTKVIQKRLFLSHFISFSFSSLNAYRNQIIGGPKLYDHVILNHKR